MIFDELDLNLRTILQDFSPDSLNHHGKIIQNRIANGDINLAIQMVSIVA